MRLTILGSGTNLHPTRAAAGYFVETDRQLLLDFGPRTLRNLLKAGVDRHTLTHILFTHYHADHFSDFITFFFDALCHTMFVGPRPDLTLIGPPGTKRLFRTILKTFPSFGEATFRVRLREVSTRSFRLGRTRITPRPVRHSTSQACLGYRVEYGGKVIAYSGDAQYCPTLVALCRNADLAVLDCSFPAGHAGFNHMTADVCGQVAQEANVRHLVLSHFYEAAERADVRRQAATRFRGRITKGRDLLRLTL